MNIDLNLRDLVVLALIVKHGAPTAYRDGDEADTARRQYAESAYLIADAVIAARDKKS